ncbi:DUF3795 domain-containing protein [Candidatus Lokiarchaeum ossiferum]
MKKRFDSYCGLYCGACEIMKINLTNNFIQAAKDRNEELENLVCDGCKSSQHCAECSICDIRKCAQDKGLEFCSECASYPCKMLLRFKSNNKPHHSAIIANLEEIKNFGVEEWLIRQETRWACPKCNTPFSWYEKTCEECGESLYHCKKEQKEILLDELSKLPLFFAL